MYNKSSLWPIFYRRKKESKLRSELVVMLYKEGTMSGVVKKKKKVLPKRD